MNSKSKWMLALVALGLIVIAPRLMGQDITEVSVQQAQSMSQHGIPLLDVREPDEYAAVHAAHAKLIPLGEVGARLKELEIYKDKPIAVICRSGRRSAQAVSILHEAGFTHAVNVKGGTSAWVQAGLEIVKQ
jgi:rhodanese-related sulfurtransferase